jgi:hypothetical protein
MELWSGGAVERWSGGAVERCDGSQNESAVWTFRRSWMRATADLRPNGLWELSPGLTQGLPWERPSNASSPEGAKVFCRRSNILSPCPDVPYSILPL